MAGRPITLCIAGQDYRVVSSADESELKRLAHAVGAKMAELSPQSRLAGPQAMLLAALALAHELEEERARRILVERRAREMLGDVLGRIDDVLGVSEE